MRYFFRDFQMNSSTRLGAICLLCLLLVLFVFWRLLPAFATPKPDKDALVLQAAWNQYKKEHIVTIDKREDRNNYQRERVAFGKSASQRAGSLFLFDPNTASENELLDLGLPPYTVRTILKYRSKARGLAFKQKEDLKRLYTLKPEDYERIAPYVRIVSLESEGGYDKSKAFIKEKAVEALPQIIEINRADVHALMTLNGIGPGYAGRIINFRNALGGFWAVEQLKEVYGFPDSTYQKLKEKFTVNSSLVQKINVNIADETELAKHPYIGKKLAFNIIRLRNDLKQFSEIEQLREVPLINEEKYRKIAPYLSTH